MRAITWTPPIEGTIKVNVDGSSFNNPGRSGFGGVLRDSNGNWLLGFSGFIGISTSLCAELHAILNGLKIAQAEGFRNIIIESDSTLAVNFACHRTSQLHPYAPLIQQIRHLHRVDWNVSFHRTLREGNECADWLAKTGASSNDTLKIWNSCPPQLSLVLLADIVGVARRRKDKYCIKEKINTT
ncbi:ribonuclease H [Trifolium pratense]|uniref:Ribonuclease H n=1 Tax=Trifolium pratense TaxID=57577 RepID=A0A2K3L4N6_TRIPR|nr:ribonuclease H [Trifolium pratense]